ncbi:MAG: flagellar motor switch protein FliN [Woeseiaceae bacterium]
MSEDDGMDEWAAAMEEAGTPMDDDKSKADLDVPSNEAGSSGKLDYEQLESTPVDNSFTGVDVNLDVILDIPVNISMEIGSTKINIRNLLQLNQGSVVELDRLAGEPLDVVVNGTLIAHGEVVVVNEKFGIRLTDIISPAERVKKLK